jgi:CheY-like chemotaxis protein
MGQARLNLKNVVALLVDRDQFGRGLVAQMLRGFGVTTILTADRGSDAVEILGQNCPDVTFIEGESLDIPTAELIRWVRVNPNKNLRFMPIIVLSGYTQLRLISVARDGGANLVVRKPISPQVLFDRLLWVAAVNRAFLESPTYNGPDRRFHAVDPPDGKLKRASDPAEQPQPLTAQA